jgi:ABC-type bacteriocin/lantibiotic exporter with double-glycine peptidase domain
MIFIDVIMRFLIIFAVFIYFFPPFIGVMFFFVVFMWILNLYLKDKFSKLIEEENDIYKENSRNLVRII